MAITAYTLESAPRDAGQGGAAKLWYGRFTAMASACEVLVDGGTRAEADAITRIVSNEAWRIEQHWSRYRDDSIIQRINTACGEPVKVDAETAQMLDFAAKIFKLSQGKFDITSGVLRRAWVFDGSDAVPTAAAIDALMPLVGWQKVDWQRPALSMPEGMQLDFGGIGKEYAVDNALRKVREASALPVLINFGGDLACDRPCSDGSPWRAGIESADGDTPVSNYIALEAGAIATSGDANRFLLKDGRRYSHVLDATTGWPVPDAPRSVTVVAADCTLAGMLSTLAMLRGSDAGAFLARQGVRHVVQAADVVQVA
ncbi:MAG: FAD:protein FMN transferase [Pseudomonadales bacterium]